MTTQIEPVDPHPSTTPMHSLEEAYLGEWERLDNLARDAGYRDVDQVCRHCGHWGSTAKECEDFLGFSIASSEFARGFAEETGLGAQEASEQWDAWSRQLSDNERDEIVAGGYESGKNMGIEFANEQWS